MPFRSALQDLEQPETLPEPGLLVGWSLE